MKVTIFTPTYNREKYLPRLYKSLVNQVNKSFEWLVIDDGSVDKTEKLIESYKKEGIINIRYYKQNNLGKHVAHNKAVELSNSELFFCVDSDDYVTPNCVSRILEIWSNRNNNNIGIVALRGYSEEQVMCNEMPVGVSESTLSDLYNVYGKKGETAIILKTEYLKANRFPVFQGEKFLSEEVLYNKLDCLGKLIVLNEIIYIMEYLEDGLTNNYINNWKKSPRGTIFLLNSRYKMSTEIKGIKKYYRMIRTILVYNAFCLKMKMHINDNSPNIFLSTLLFIPSIIIRYFKFG